jgi:hypothetical protein
MREKLIAFLDSPRRNTWLTSGGISVYVRKGFHIGSDGQPHTYLDIANIEVKPKLQRKGRYKAFLALCHELQPYDGIYHENVHNEILRSYYRRLALTDDRWSERGQHFFWETHGAGGGSRTRVSGLEDQGI